MAKVLQVKASWDWASDGTLKVVVEVLLPDDANMRVMKAAMRRAWKEWGVRRIDGFQDFLTSRGWNVMPSITAYDSMEIS